MPQEWGADDACGWGTHPGDLVHKAVDEVRPGLAQGGRRPHLPQKPRIPKA